MRGRGFIPSHGTWPETAGLALYWLVSFAVWLLVNAAIAAGVMAGLFIMFANANFDGFFIEARHLAQHYLDAPAAARRDFEALALIAFAVIFIAVSACRLGSLLRHRMGAENEVEHG